ncbi:MAG: stage III sporulation protein AA [Bacillota bacterium]|nr:stage III sporulation protein AA [Bacillota bacterium]
MEIKAVLEILPASIRKKLEETENMNNLQEIRIKIGKPIIFQIGSKETIYNYIASNEDLKNIMQRMSNYSLYAFNDALKQGYITLKGGHRVGICGSCVVEENEVKTIKDIASINIRIGKEIMNCSNNILPYIIDKQSILNSIIISPPKCGKTTMLRDVARNISNGIDNLSFKGKKVSIIDERSEIAGCYNGIPQMEVGLRTDVLDSCPKSQGIMMAIRSMSPDVIICDEIGTYRDMESLLMALNSGVSIITSIHGKGIEDLFERAVYKEIIENNVFERAVILSSEKIAGTIDYIYDLPKKEIIWGK